MVTATSYGYIFNHDGVVNVARKRKDTRGRYERDDLREGTNDRCDPSDQEGERGLRASIDSQPRTGARVAPPTFSYAVQLQTDLAVLEKYRAEAQAQGLRQTQN